MGGNGARFIPANFINRFKQTAVISENKGWGATGQNPERFEVVTTKPPENPSKEVSRTKDGQHKIKGMTASVVNKTVVSLTDQDGNVMIPYINGRNAAGKYTISQIRGMLRRNRVEFRPVRKSTDKSLQDLKRQGIKPSELRVTG